MDRPPACDTQEFIDYYTRKLRVWTVAMGMLPVVMPLKDLRTAEYETFAWNDYDAFAEYVKGRIGSRQLQTKILIIEFSPSGEVGDCIIVVAKPPNGKYAIEPKDMGRKWFSHLHSQIKRTGWGPIIEVAEQKAGVRLLQLLEVHANRMLGGNGGFSLRRLEVFALWNGIVYGAMAEFEELSASVKTNGPIREHLDVFAGALARCISDSGDLGLLRECEPGKRS